MFCSYARTAFGGTLMTKTLGTRFGQGRRWKRRSNGFATPRLQRLPLTATIQPLLSCSGSIELSFFEEMM